MSNEEIDIIALRARVAELEDRLEYLYKRLNIEYVANPSAVDPRIIEYLKKGNKIEAIKIYREIHNVGLAEAKNVVDGIATSLGL
ncbi:MAG: ribosomal protein L7/L12 [Anaerolineales bacterium]|nr:ribosomal protein L7/L12 [Anaerolineales bacterium]